MNQRENNASEECIKQIVKGVMVGDNNIGKTSLLHAYQTGSFPNPEGYLPSLYDEFDTDMIINDSPLTLNLSDTGGGEYYPRIRPLSYFDKNILLLCFSIDNHVSMEHIRNEYHPEVKRYRPEAGLILVGTKTDLRNDESTIEKLEKQGLSPISMQQGKDLAEKLGIEHYMECSALTLDGVKDLFKQVATIGLNYPATKLPKRRKCNIL